MLWCNMRAERVNPLSAWLDYKHFQPVLLLDQISVLLMNECLNIEIWKYVI